MWQRASSGSSGGGGQLTFYQNDGSDYMPARFASFDTGIKATNNFAFWINAANSISTGFFDISTNTFTAIRYNGLNYADNQYYPVILPNGNIGIYYAGSGLTGYNLYYSIAM